MYKGLHGVTALSASTSPSFMSSYGRPPGFSTWCDLIHQLLSADAAAGALLRMQLAYGSHGWLLVAPTVRHCQLHWKRLQGLAQCRRAMQSCRR
jgi:hypothetical protein